MQDVFCIDPYTVKLGYNEQLGTGHFCSLKPEFVITGLFCALKWPIYLTLKSVRYNRVFVNNRVRYNRVRYNRVRYNRVRYNRVWLYLFIYSFQQHFIFGPIQKINLRIMDMHAQLTALYGSVKLFRLSGKLRTISKTVQFFGT